MESFARGPIEQFLVNRVEQPAVLAVDKLARPALSSFLLRSISFPNSKVRNVIALEDRDAFTDNDALCGDIGGVRLVIAIVTSVQGEEQLETLRTMLPAEVKLEVIFSVLDSKRVFDGRSSHVAMCLEPKSSSTFTLTTESCAAPMPILVKSAKSNAFELDLDVDLQVEYKSRLKRTSLALGTGIMQQINWDISEAVFSIGFGANLIANTICAHVQQNQTSALRQKASLLIIDRSMDLWTALHDPKLEPMQRLHDQLVLADQSGDILPQLLIALDRKTLNAKQALGLAVRACSLAGNKFDLGLGGGKDFAARIGVPHPSLSKLFQEVARARQDCVRNVDENDDAQQFAIGGPFDTDASFIGSILGKFITSATPLPSCVVRANKFDVTNVAMNLFGNFLGGDSQKTERDKVLRTRTNIVVFFLGGYSDLDEKLIRQALPSSHRVLLGGSQCKTAREFREALFDALIEYPLGGGVASTGKLQENFSNLFA